MGFFVAEVLGKNGLVLVNGQMLMVASCYAMQQYVYSATERKMK